MAESNLIPQSERTKEEQRRIAQMGGIASGEARRRKRDLRQVVQMVLDEKVKTTAGEEVEKRVAMVRVQVKQAIEGDVKSARLVADWSGEAPTRQELMGEDGAPLIPRSVEEAQKLLESE